MSLNNANSIKIGIIGGTGLDDPDILEDRWEEVVDNVFGSPSDALIHGKISGVDCVLLARHGRKHNISPTNINYRANIWALKNAGCTHVIASNACGSLKKEVQAGDFVFLDNIIDLTTKRTCTFYDGATLGAPQGILHLPMEPVFSKELRQVLIASATELGIKHHSAGTCVTIEGPRYSSKAESNLYRSWGASVVNMTCVPESVLAKEAGLLYASVAMVTDCDCWRDDGENVSVERVARTFEANSHKITKLFKYVVPKIAEQSWEEPIENLQGVLKGSLML